MINTDTKLARATALEARVQTALRPVSLPPFRALATSAVIANALIAVALLLTGHKSAVGSTVAGLVIGLVMYAGIYSFVNGAASMLVGSIGGQAVVQPRGFMPQFALLTIGKFILLGALLFIMFRYIHVNLLQLLIGFMITQIVITLVCVRSLKATPLIGP